MGLPKENMFFLKTDAHLEACLRPLQLFLETAGEPPVPWHHWLDMLKNHVDAVGLSHADDEKLKSALVLSLGKEGEHVLCILGQADSFSECVTLMEKYYSDTTNVMAQRIIFFCRKQHAETLRVQTSPNCSTDIMPESKKSGSRRSSATEAKQPPPYEPNIPEPTTRADFIKHWLPLSLDDKTAQKLLWISEGGMKVARTNEAVCPYPTRPERYEHSPQVLCKEGLLGYRGYWEVDYDGWVVIGVVCESSPRKGSDGPTGIGENNTSWGVGWSGSCYQVWHKGENVDIKLSQTSTMGVYVDQPAGIIKFLAVEGEGVEKEVHLIHTFNENLQEKVFPGFWIGACSFCLLKKKDQ
ncbi:tripartite motif-containing protein 16-like protein [Pholidichthys leucotaenia]